MYSVRLTVNVTFAPNTVTLRSHVKRYIVKFCSQGKTAQQDLTELLIARILLNKEASYWQFNIFCTCWIHLQAINSNASSDTLTVRKRQRTGFGRSCAQGRGGESFRKLYFGLYLICCYPNNLLIISCMTGNFGYPEIQLY